MTRKHYVRGSFKERSRRWPRLRVLTHLWWLSGATESGSPRRECDLYGQEESFDGCSRRWIRSTSMPASLLNLFSATRSIPAKNTLNNSGEGTHPWRGPCATSNHSEHRSSSPRTHALIPSWNWRITSIICGGLPKRASICQRSVRSTESYAFCRSMKHRNSDTRAFLPNSCSFWTANIISVVERCGRRSCLASDAVADGYPLVSPPLSHLSTHLFITF